MVQPQLSTAETTCSRMEVFSRYFGFLFLYPNWWLCGSECDFHPVTSGIGSSNERIVSNVKKSELFRFWCSVFVLTISKKRLHFLKSGQLGFMINWLHSDLVTVTLGPYHSCDVISQEHLDGISSYLSRASTWTQWWTDQILVLKGQTSSSLCVSHSHLCYT